MRPSTEYTWSSAGVGAILTSYTDCASARQYTLTAVCINPAAELNNPKSSVQEDFRVTKLYCQTAGKESFGKVHVLSSQIAAKAQCCH